MCQVPSAKCTAGADSFLYLNGSFSEYTVYEIHRRTEIFLCKLTSFLIYLKINVSADFKKVYTEEAEYLVTNKWDLTFKSYLGLRSFNRI